MSGHVVQRLDAPERLALDPRPQFAQPIEPLTDLVAGDDGAVDRADRRADDPIRLDPGFVHGLIDAALVGAERAAALEHQDHLPGHGRPRRRGAGRLMDDIVHGRMTALCSLDERLTRWRSLLPDARKSSAAPDILAQKYR